jgi:tubulin--tyrosine ligase
VYCAASGALDVCFYTRVLALFASQPWSPPGGEIEADEKALEVHLTNTSLFRDPSKGESYVHLLSELKGFRRLDREDSVLDDDGIERIYGQIDETLAEVFEAAVSNPVNFMVRRYRRRSPMAPTFR